MSLPFREGIDPEDCAEICEWTNDKYCSERIDWAVAKVHIALLVT
jgi:hypothetical protein